MPLRILHVSDIHFNNSGWDEDLDQRTELVRDVATHVQQAGRIDAILIGGDIAFGATAEQYDTARVWIEQLMRACGGLEPVDVWVVPGNHDVSWDVINRSPIAQDFRRQLTETPLEDIDIVLHQRLSLDPEASAVMAPLQAFNDFAADFGCQVTADAPMWADDTLELDGLIVRITGINSVLASFQDSHEPDGLNLVVGSHQVRLDRHPDLIHLVMMHHPPSWLRDWDRVAPYLKRAHLILFGHEHSYSSLQPDGAGTSVHVNAGAVAPERQRGGERDPFLSTYNIITLEKNETEIGVLVEPRYWDRPTTRFVDHGAGSQSYRVALDPTAGFDGTAPRASQQAATAGTASPLVAEDDGVPNPRLTPEDRRDLRRIALRFYRLPVTRRREIGRSLGVLDDDDLIRPSAELWTDILVRIRDRGLIDQLEMEIQ